MKRAVTMAALFLLGAVPLLWYASFLGGNRHHWNCPGDAAIYGVLAWVPTIGLGLIALFVAIADPRSRRYSIALLLGTIVALATYYGISFAMQDAAIVCPSGS